MSVGIISGAMVRTFLTEKADEIAKRFEKQQDDEYLARLVQKVFEPGLTVEIFKSNFVSGNKIQKVMDYLVKWKDLSTIVDILTHDAKDFTLKSSPNVVIYNIYETGKVNFYHNVNLNGGLWGPGGPGTPHFSYIVANKIYDSGLKSDIGSPVFFSGGLSLIQEGGFSGGFFVIIAKEFDMSNSVIDNSGFPSREMCGPWGYGPEDGGKGADGSMIVLDGDSPGNGGSGNTAFPAGQGGLPGGGGGSGCGPRAKGGAGGKVNLITYNTVDDLWYDLMSGVIDYWIVNVLGKDLDVVRPLIDVRGGGGGGGAGWDEEYYLSQVYLAVSGGGGGGGETIIIGDKVNIGTLTARGGRSNCGCGSYGNYYFGGGGGGGVIYVMYKTSCNVSLYDVSGGLGYSSGCFTEYSSVFGSNGTSGTYREIQV